MSHFHAPIPANDERNLPVRELAPPACIWPTLDALLATDSQMKLINRAHGHPPRSKSHPRGSGGLRGHFHVAIPANDRRISPLPSCLRFGRNGGMWVPSWSWIRK